LSLIKYQAMNVYVRVEVQLHALEEVCGRPGQITHSTQLT